MADLVYLDTSALLRWAASVGGSPENRDSRGKSKLEELVAGPQELGASPITIAEFTSVLYDYVRTNEPWGSFFEPEDADTCTERFMSWLADGTIAIRPLGLRAFEMGMAYVEMAATRGRRMRGWDAIHLYEAARWARDTGERVTIATSDGDFRKMIELFPEFAAYLDVIDVSSS